MGARLRPQLPNFSAYNSVPNDDNASNKFTVSAAVKRIFVQPMNQTETLVNETDPKIQIFNEDKTTTPSNPTEDGAGRPSEAPSPHTKGNLRQLNIVQQYCPCCKESQHLVCSRFFHCSSFSDTGLVSALRSIVNSLVSIGFGFRLSA